MKDIVLQEMTYENAKKVIFFQGKTQRDRRKNMNITQNQG